MLHRRTAPVLFGLALALPACNQIREVLDGGVKGEREQHIKGAGRAAPGSTATADSVSVAPAPPPEGEWVNFQSEADGVRADFPLAPKAGTMPTQTVVGTLDQKMFSAEKDDAFYGLTVIEYPKSLMADAKVPAMLDGARNGAVNNIGGKLLSEAQVKVQGHPCRRISVAAAEQGIALDVDALLCLAGRRLVQGIVVRPEGKLSQAEVQRFLGGLRIEKI